MSHPVVVVRVHVFEGFSIFFSGDDARGPPHGTSIVLNSVSLREKALHAIRTLNPRVVEVYRDNDAAG